MLNEKITKEDFFKYLNLIRRNSEIISKIYSDSYRTIDIINLDELLCEPYRIIEKLFFTTDELDIISWYIFEYTEGKMKIYDNNDMIADIVDDEALWEYLNRRYE